MKRAYASYLTILVAWGLILFVNPFTFAQEEGQPETRVAAPAPFKFDLSKVSFGAYGQVSLPVDPYLETHSNPGPGCGLSAEYQLASWTKAGVEFRYSFHKGVDRTEGTGDHRIDWRTTGESIYGKFFPGYSQELPFFALVEISFYQFRPTHHVSYLNFPFGGKEEDGKTRTRIGLGMGMGLESKITEKISVDLQALFMTFANKNISFRFDSGYYTRMSNETRLLILQGGILFYPF